MGVKVKKRNGAWWVFINYHGRRKARKIGTRDAAEKVKRELEARLALGDIGCLSDPKQEPTFADYAQKWLRTDALRCKASTIDFYRDYQARYVTPRFGLKKITDITRDDIKVFMAELTERDLARNTIRLAVAALRVVLSSAVEDGLLASNPAFRLGRFVESHKAEHEAQAMEPGEVEAFLIAAREYCPLGYYVLFLVALRAGLRQGEILGLKWGDFQFGQGGDDPNRYILVQRRWYRGRFSTPKGNRTRRVDMSKELRQALMELRDARMLEAFQAGMPSIADDLVFPGEKGPVSVRTLSENYFLPALERANLRRFRFHDLRHTFGSLLIEAGAPLPYVRDQMGHSSIQITADKYVHLLAGRNVRFIDRLDALKDAQPNATQAQPEAQRGKGSIEEVRPQVIEEEVWCERGDSNPHGFPRQILSLVRLPIPPLSH
jgi:integrase